MYVQFFKKYYFTLKSWVTLISCAYHLKNKGEGGFTNSLKRPSLGFLAYSIIKAYGLLKAYSKNKSYINATKLQLKPLQLNKIV